MRRLIESLRDEARGAASVLVAFSLVILLMAAALTIDVGLMYAERAELQNSADAAALAIADDCANSRVDCASYVSTALSMVNVNARDGATKMESVDKGVSSVRVIVKSKDAKTGFESLALNFAPVIGLDEVTVGATATAGWATFPKGGPAVLPLAFTPCAFDLTKGIQVIQTHGQGTPSCASSNPSGAALPGGFRWLDSPAGKCEAHVDLDTPANMSSDPGNNISAACVALLSSLKNEILLLPVYQGVQDVSGSGTNGSYTIKGWAGFKLLGWNFPGTSWNAETYPGAHCKTGGCNGLIGQFVNFGSLGDEFTSTTDPSADFGASIVALTE